MAWYWTALILGIIAPWLLMTAHIVGDFRGGGLRTGLGTWFGFSLVTTSIMFLIIGLGQFVIG